MEKSVKIKIGIAIAIVVAIVAVVCAFGIAYAQANEKYPGVSEEQFVGTYTAKMSDGKISTLVIKPDRTFTESYYGLSDTWERFGKWTFTNNKKYPESIDFHFGTDSTTVVDMSFYRENKSIKVTYRKSTA